MSTLLRFLHNSLTPVHRLPTETLCAVFERTVDRTQDVVADALSLSHVCRRWRHTALEYPRLWDNFVISQDPKNIVPFCLERSKSVPLSIAIKFPEPGEYNPEDDTIRQNLQLIALHHGRIRSMELLTNFATRSLLQYLDFDAPQLQEFVCVVRRHDSDCDELDSDDEEEEEMALFLPPSFFCRKASSPLKLLSLTDVPTPCFSSFENLTTIILSSRQGNALPISSFLNLLRRCPLLGTLKVIGYDVEEDTYTEKPVSLNVLNELNLIDLDPGFVLSYLDPPALSKLIISSPLPPLRPVGLFANKAQLISIGENISTLKLVHFRGIIGLDSSGSLCLEIQGDSDLVLDFHGIPGSSLANCTELEINWFNGIVGSVWAKSVIQLLPNAIRLNTLKLWQPGFCMEVLKQLLADTSLCPELDAIHINLGKGDNAGLDEMAGSVVTSRAAVGRNIRIEHLSVPEDSDRSSIRDER